MPRSDPVAASAGPVPVSGLFEAHLSVSDLASSVVFYRDVVGLSLALEMPKRRAAFFWTGQAGDSMLGLWPPGSAPLGAAGSGGAVTQWHVAFRTSVEAVLDACERLRSLGVIPLAFSGTETREPSVIGWMPAAAVYIRDPDGHLLEYVAMLEEPPHPELGVVPWSVWSDKR
jgi:lactoylglutathione lyase